MADHSTFGIGGRARLFGVAGSSDEVVSFIQKATRQKYEWEVIGQGSNILFSDKDIDKCIVVFRSAELPKINSNVVSVSGGFSVSSLVDIACSLGLSGLENLAGLPGTIGGAIAGNAGAYGSNISENLLSVTVMKRDGRIENLEKTNLHFEYRHSNISEDLMVVLEAKFAFDRKDTSLLKTVCDERVADRKRKHPDYRQIPTAGSFFKNPFIAHTRVSAGKLIAEAGCTNLRVGGATQWHLHPNILINDRNATTSDVLELSAMIKSQVLKVHGVELENEVKVI